MKAIVLLNHKPTDEQIEQLKKLGVEVIIEPLDYMKNIFANIPPDADENTLNIIVSEITNWIEDIAEEGNYVWVQGEAGATYIIVQRAKEIGLTPIYATTKRVSVEEEIDGKIIKKSVFKHCRFREYTNPTAIII